MPVTVKVGQKKKPVKATTEAVVPTPELADYASPNERSEGIKAFWLWFVLMLLISLAPMASDGTRPIGIAIFVWWVGSSLVYLAIAPRMVLRRLRMHGDEFLISAKNQPRLNALITKGSALLEIDQPEAYMVEESFTHVRAYNGGQPFLLISKATAAMLQVTELDCLVIRALIQQRQRQVRRHMLVQLLAYTHPAARFLAWPIAIYAGLLRAFWSDLADQTADRLTLLIMKNDKLLMGAILKQFAASDPLMMENNVTAEDVDNYIKQGGIIDTSGSSISTQYKIGSSISANPFIEDRVTALRSWASSIEYREALQSLAKARAQATPAAKVPPPLEN